MKPGRLPENHPLEQLARAKLREPSPQAVAKAQQQRDTELPPPPIRQRPAPRRWGAR